MEGSLARHILGGAVALAIVGGAAFALSGSAHAESWHDACHSDGACVRTHCYDDGSCTHTAYFTPAGLRDENDLNAQPMRYACDADGDNCRYTHYYHINAFGDPVRDTDSYGKLFP